MEEMMISFVIIPFDLSKPLQNLQLNQSLYLQKGRSGDLIPSFIVENYSSNALSIQVEIKPEDIKVSPLLRLHKAENGEHFGIYAYCVNSNRLNQNPNIRATCLAMACGLHSSRYQGDVFISKLGYDQNQQIMNMDISKEVIQYGCISPDIRKSIIFNILSMKQLEEEKTTIDDIDMISIPSWLANASKFNYEDAGALEALAEVMKTNATPDQMEISSDDKDSHDSDDSSEEAQTCEEEDEQTNEFVARESLCLYCRGCCDNLCSICEGVYFCPRPRLCSNSGWSHQCLCITWRLYTQRRKELSNFGFDEWHVPLMGRSFQLSDAPYESFLADSLGVLDSQINSWWTTEINGWCGGLSGSAMQVNALTRLSYAEGFRMSEENIPPERRVASDDWIGKVNKDECHLLQLDSWEDYYKVRDIPLSSPVALLLTFPLTIYYAIQKHGAVAVTVANMLNRPLRVHVVGIEKELNMIDIFKEVGYLLPKELKLELVFIVRKDMLPPKCHEIESRSRNGCDIEIRLLENLTIILKSGYYCHDLDPIFDCGSGPPDMIIGMNAGIFAYKSWRNVLAFLNSKNNRGVIGVFTDYNEHSGVNCASLGGCISRESIHINPFRQPRAMPVFSMNLPQFSNGFMYIYNQQELDA